MKKIIGLVIIVTIFLLLFTKSLYVEWDELIIIIVSLAIISLLFNSIFNKQGKYSVLLSSSVIIGFLLFWVLALFDLIIDHYLYFLPSGNEDGRALTLLEKIKEFNDDLFVGSIISMISVIIISFLLTILMSKETIKNTEKKIKKMGNL